MTTAAGLRTSYVGIDSEYLAPSDECSGATIGESPDAQIVAKLLREALQDYCLPASRRDEPRRAQFLRWSAEWKRATEFESSLHAIAMQAAYQRIIGMGDEAIPYILEELLREPDHWFWALTSITGVDPVPPGDSGDLQRMTEAWIRWGRIHGYVD